jgi:predicted Na+-dependent transporter
MRHLGLFLLIIVAFTSWTCLGDVIPLEEAQVSARFSPSNIKLNMDNTTQVNYTLVVDKKALASGARALRVDFQLITLSPQFDIVEFDPRSSKGHKNNTVSSVHSDVIDVKQLHQENYIFNHSFYLKATYIGHALIKLSSKLIKDDGTEESLNTATATNGQITIIRNEGILDKIFMYSVIVFITISYINLGAQIDVDNVRRLIATPKIIFFGLLIGIVVMPSCSWIAGHLLFQDQPMYRIGSFIYACAPAASASVLWTVMFDADKELALGLQISSTVGALITMPIFLYAMDKSIDLEGQYTIKVPYLNLTRTLVVLLIALLIGSRLVGRNKRARQISQMIFRPLTMFVLLFIIIFSSIVYWYVYRMFNLHITLMAFIVTCATYVLSGLLGYLINRDIDHMITISISSTYRNSGIAFAALVVAFQPPDIFIAYVPCLTQVVTTSLIGLVLYAIKSLKKKK